MEAHQLVGSQSLALPGEAVAEPAEAIEAVAGRGATGAAPAALAPPVEAVGVAIVRRALDIAVSSLLLLVLAPLLIVIALAVRMESPGSSVFRQRRFGRQMSPFAVNKFRSMRADADAAPHREYVRSLITGGGEAVDRDGGPSLYKLAVDDRITRVGRFLRRWSLDELPQLWNVLIGDMSLVGPRPVVPYELEHYPEWYFRRFAVKPGLTGLWQVSGRNERTYEEMVGFDVEYVDRRSLRLDLVILVRTAWVVVSRRGAA